MEKMKIEIEKSEYDRLKSREEKLLAYYGWFVDKENDLATVEDVINENIELHNTLEDVYKEKRELGEEKRKLKEELRMLKEGATLYREDNKKLREENKKLKEENEFFYKSAKQFREDAESWRKECERLLGLQLCGKTIAERIEDDKKVLRE